MSIQKVLYVANVTAVGGRDGRAVSSNGILDVSLARPCELGGSGNSGTNPEELFAAAYSASFIGAMRLVADRDHITLPDNISIDASVGMGTTPGGFGIKATLRISLPGLPRADVKSLVIKAHSVCPYSNATNGNVDVELIVL